MLVVIKDNQKIVSVFLKMNLLGDQGSCCDIKVLLKLEIGLRLLQY